MYKRLAERIMFGGQNKINFDDFGLEFRKNKTVHDINHAISKSKKNGHLKTETELDMLEIYLKDVLKKRRG